MDLGYGGALYSGGFHIIDAQGITRGRVWNASLEAKVGELSGNSSPGASYGRSAGIYFLGGDALCESCHCNLLPYIAFVVSGNGAGGDVSYCWLLTLRRGGLDRLADRMALPILYQGLLGPTGIRFFQ